MHSRTRPRSSRTPLCFFFNDTATTEIYTLPLHDALPISATETASRGAAPPRSAVPDPLRSRSEEHTSELQSRSELVCRLLLEKKQTSLLGPEPQPSALPATNAYRARRRT